jgi:type VI secretion system protein ImpA
MARPEPLDIEPLIAPIPGDDPAGKPLLDSTRLRLDEDRKEADPLDPSTADRKANWPGIISLAKSTLTNSSKDLLVAVRLVEALVRKNEFVGLRDGIKLLRLFVENCWDRMYPLIEDGDLEVRAGPFKWLNDATRGAKFPSAIQSIAVVRKGGENFNYFDSIDDARKIEFEDAISTIKADDLKQTWEDLQETLKELETLGTLLDEKVTKEHSPDLMSADNPNNIGSAVRNCATLFEDLARRKGVKLRADADSEGGESADSGESQNDTGGSRIVVGRTNREGLYRQLEQIADALQAIEPHSPIPYLVKRAVRLGSLPFPELMRAMIRETGTLDELDRLLGLQQQTPSE